MFVSRSTAGKIISQNKALYSHPLCINGMFCWMGVVAMSEKILKAATVKESFKRKAQKTFDIWVEFK